MNLEPYIKPKPWYLKLIPGISSFTANTIYPYIFLPLPIYENLRSENPNPYHVALLIHEKFHYKRQGEMGIFKFALKYIFSSKFRFAEELMAVQEAIKYLKSNRFQFDFDEKARSFSSWLYLWPVSRSYTKSELHKIWEEI